MKILYVTTIGTTMNFFNSLINELINSGYEVDIACNEQDSPVPECYKTWGCKIFNISCSRSPLNKGNIHAVYELRNIVSCNNYDIVHCHTPIAAMCTRLACKSIRKNGTKVFYTAHGFHFYKGAPLKNWLLFYPVEKICAHFTDVLITINNEDYKFAKKRLKATTVEYVPGVGIDLEKFKLTNTSNLDKRRELGISKKDFLLLSVGELNSNKNHELVIRAIKEIEELNLYYVIAGQGELKLYLQNLINELDLSERVKLLGFRNDIKELCVAADLFVFPSFREGLSVAIMEAMACAKPCVVSQIRGNTDLIDRNGGEYFNPSSVDECKAAIERILKSDLEKLGQYNFNKVQMFGLNKIILTMKMLYDKKKQ